MKSVPTYVALYLFWVLVVSALCVVGFNWAPSLEALPVPMGLGVVPFILHLVIV